MCPHITLQNSGHTDYLFLAGHKPRQRSLGHCFGIELPWAAAQLRMPMDHSQNMNTSTPACRGQQAVATNKRWKERSRDLWGAVQQDDYFYHWPWEYLNKCWCHVCPVAAWSFVCHVCSIFANTQRGKRYTHIRTIVMLKELMVSYMFSSLFLVWLLSSIHLHTTMKLVSQRQGGWPCWCSSSRKLAERKSCCQQRWPPCSSQVSFYSQKCVRNGKKAWSWIARMKFVLNLLPHKGVTSPCLKWQEVQPLCESIGRDTSWKFW